MNGDVVKLNQVRKERSRAEKERLAEANRLKFGRTMAEKERSKAEKLLSAAILDGHKRDP